MSQPVGELLLASQISTMTEPTVLLYANRQVFRPFIYYKSADILLTTKEAYKWFHDNHVDVMGVVFMAVLMQSSKYLVYRENLGTTVGDQPRSTR